MLRLRVTTIGRKWLAAILLVLAGTVTLGYYLIPGEPDIPPDQAIKQAMLKTAKAESYEYNIKMTTLIDGVEQLVSSVRGERQDPGNIHIKGRMFDSDMDFYQIGSTTFSKDQLSGEWIKITDNQINQQEIFLFELNPLASFSYKELNDARYLATEKIDGRKYWVFTASPVIDNQYMEVLWKDFNYKFWVEPGSLLIYRAVVSAVSKNNPADKMNLFVEFINYNGDIEVKPPK